MLKSALYVGLATLCFALAGQVSARDRELKFDALSGELLKDKEDD